MALHYERYPWRDYVTGTAAELAAAGIVTADMLPGQPGTGKTMATYMDGRRVMPGARVAAHREKNETYRSILRKGKDRYRVTVELPPAEVKRRLAQEKAEQEQAEAAAWACLIHADAPPHWIGRIGLHFAVIVVRRQHLRPV